MARRVGVIARAAGAAGRGWLRGLAARTRDNAVRLQLHALAYNLANFMRTLALPKEVEQGIGQPPGQNVVRHQLLPIAQ